MNCVMIFPLPYPEPSHPYGTRTALYNKEWLYYTVFVVSSGYESCHYLSSYEGEYNFDPLLCESNDVTRNNSLCQASVGCYVP